MRQRIFTVIFEASDGLIYTFFSGQTTFCYCIQTKPATGGITIAAKIRIYEIDFSYCIVTTFLFFLDDNIVQFFGFITLAFRVQIFSV